MSFPCPHCGGEIVVTPGMNPFPGWRNPDAIPDAKRTQNSRNSGATPDIAHVSRSKSSTKRTPYNQGYDLLFLEFWDVYPLKRDKRKAAQSWRNANARATANAILEGAKRYRDDPNRIAGFTKYAEGWLNGDGWEDEPLPSRLPTDPEAEERERVRQKKHAEARRFVEEERRVRRKEQS